MTNRQIKIVCRACGYTARTTRVWIEVGLPTCNCGQPMKVAGKKRGPKPKAKPIGAKACKRSILEP